jgi:hypothetical protein
MKADDSPEYVKFLPKSNRVECLPDRTKAGINRLYVILATSVQESHSASPDSQVIKEQHLPRSRSLSPARHSFVPSQMKAVVSMPNLQATRQDYNRQLGQSLDKERGSGEKEATAASLTLIDTLLQMVK